MDGQPEEPERNWKENRNKTGNEVNQMNEIADALTNTLSTPNEMDSNFETANVTDALFAIARAIERNAKALERLGTNGATTEMGAIELLASEVKRIADDVDPRR